MIIGINDEVEFSSSTIDSAFGTRNKIADQSEWEDGLLLLIKNIKR